MVAVLRDVGAHLDIRSTDNAHDFAVILQESLPGCALICLDHDLGPARMIDGAMTDPGDGRDAARVLAPRIPCCPIIVHSTNVVGALSMCQTLRSAGWTVEQVIPYGDLEWIEQSWRPLVTELLPHS